MKVRIGIPRTLAFYAFYPWWKGFLESLGLQPVVSAPTSRAILDAGVAAAVADACIPVKLYHGHVLNLQERVEYILVPRFVSVRRLETESFCPKFLGLPDMIREPDSRGPRLIDVRVDLAAGRRELLRVGREVGAVFGAGWPAVLHAYYRAGREMNRYRQLLQQRLTPPEALAVLEGAEPAPAEQGELCLAVMGYPYVLYDRFLNLDLLRRLRGQGVRVVTAEMVSPRQLRAEARRFPKNLFWHFSNQVLHAAAYYTRQQWVDGVIHVSSFGCGPDAMLGKMLELMTKRAEAKPFLTVLLDEHTGAGGLQTRLEAYVDMLKRRRGRL